MSAQAKITGTETAGTTKPPPPAHSLTERWGSRPPVSPGKPNPSLARAEIFGPSLYGVSSDAEIEERNTFSEPLPATVEVGMAEFSLAGSSAWRSFDEGKGK